LAFVATGKQTATDAHANAHLGASVSDALDGYFIAGAPGADGTGAAYEFYVEDGNYENRIQPCDLQAGDQFGASVAYMEIDGERTVAVGAPMSDRMWTDGAIAEDLENAGKAYLFNYDTDEFNLSSILSGDSDADDHFGYALGFDNLGRCIVGAPSDETDGSDEGLLYVYGLFDSTPPAVDVLDIPDYVTCEDGDDYILDLQDYITNTSNDALEFTINSSFIQSTELNVSNAGSVVTVDFSPLGAFEQDITVDVHNIMTHAKTSASRST
jgi:hypothetical protein